MEQSPPPTIPKSSSPFFDDQDIEVASILVQLPQLIYRSNRSRVLPVWSTKRRRSAICRSDSELLPPPPCELSKPAKIKIKGLHSLPSSGSGRPITVKEEEPVKPERKPTLPGNSVKPIKIKDEPPSWPEATTRAGYGYSEAKALNLKPKRKIIKKKSKEELEKQVAVLTTNNNDLVESLKRVRLHNYNLKMFNLKLKARKEELFLYNANSNLGGDRRVGLKILESTIHPPTPVGEDHRQDPTIAHQSPSVVNQMVHMSDTFGRLQHPYGQVLAIERKILR